ncbi:MAG: LysR family transcriptional regulator [Pseudohongiella sp.]|nr:LysR family transcriptional regulator [Pseudohongiella sp.]MDO9520836.1 LysR family transcriptional regulator [Pseudohongiella sp.]MDP2128101.1 LysR family transcriptional regulator [Pseudohongiella sp.]
MRHARLKKLDLNLFLVFDTIYTERNLTQAAKSLAITQPAVSNALSRLRRVFNDELFVRTSKGMLPTPVADGIAQNISAALALINASVLEREDFTPSSAERTYHFSMTDLAEAVILPRLFPFFEQQAPHLALQSYYTKRHELVRHLSRGELDFAIDVPLIEDTQVSHESLIRDDYVCAMRPDHPMADEPLTLDSYLSMRHIHVSSRRKGLGQVDMALLKHQAERKIQLRVQHYRVAAEVISGTDLVLTVPRFLASQYSLTLRPLPFAVPALDLHLYWHRQSDSDPSHRWLRESLLTLFQK